MARRGRRGGSGLALLTLAATLLPSAPRRASAQEPVFRRIAELDLLVLGLQALVTEPNPVVPKNIATAIPARVTAGGTDLSEADLVRFLGPGYHLEAELSGPGLSQTITLPRLDPGEEPPADPLLLPVPPLASAGSYTVSNLRIVSEGRTVLDVTPRSLALEVIDQILVTSVKTRALTLDEIKAKGIVLDSDDYLGFEFTLGLMLESEAIDLSFPVVFDREGVPVPQPLRPPPLPTRGVVPTVMPLLLEAYVDEDGDPSTPPEKLPLTVPGTGAPVRIPSVLVIPGNVGFLKQFFSAQLFVANGAPVGSGLSVRDVTGTIQMPPGLDQASGTADDPLALPELERDGEVILQPETLPILGVGPDGAPGSGDDDPVFGPAEQGQAEFLLRGEREGFHQLSFDIAATLDGLPVGPVGISGTARGGVLVRNPFFDVTFSVPSVVRNDEPFSMFVTVTNIGQGIGNDVSVTLDAARMSGATLLGDAAQSVDTLLQGDSATLEYEFRGDRTGQVVASYLNFSPGAAGGGDLRFTLAVGERGVPLSPDTLVLPASVESVPQSVVDAAMRVLGQAWSVANAPAGTLPSSVERTSRAVVTEKALALAEAGLRVDLGQPVESAVRDLGFDFYGGTPLDPGFDQLLRQTGAGRELAAALGSELALPMLAAGGPLAYEAELARLAASGPDFLSLAVGAGASAAAVDVSVRDALGRDVVFTNGAAPESSTLPGGLLLPFGSPSSGPLLGLVTAPDAGPYTIALAARSAGPVDLSVTLPRGDGTFQRGHLSGVELPAGSRARIVADRARPDGPVLELDLDGDGTFEAEQALSVETLVPEGPRLVAAAIIGPETLGGAAPFGMQLAILFDRVVDDVSSADIAHYAVPDNELRAARRQLSGRLVFAALSQPEGNFLPTTLDAEGVRDTRGATGPSGSVSLVSRILDPGAVVSGRVFNADGSAVTSGLVTYLNNTDISCRIPRRTGLAAVQVDGQGRFEFRYVRRDACGVPWELVTVDPGNGARRAVTGFVRANGEQIVVDIALIGRGMVEGYVTDLSGAAVAGAAVTALSLEDNQSGGTAVTDGTGFYSISGVTVGPVSVRAVQGTALGQSTGRIDRAGTAGRVDVLLDGGAVTVSGQVFRSDAGAQPIPVPGLQVVYTLTPLGDRSTTVGVTQTGANGEFRFEAMPTGRFTISAALNTRDRAALTEIGAAGDVLTGRNLLIVVPPDAEFGTVTGIVRLPDGSPAPDVIVTLGGAGVLSGDGTFTITGVPVKPGVSQGVSARTRDGLRKGSTSVLVSAPGEVVQAEIFLSGVGSATFTVLDPAGNPVSGQEVRLFNGCADPCGCVAGSTDSQGRASFGGLGVGTVTARAYGFSGPAVDVATGSATIKSDGGTGFGVLQFAGSGSVTGLVQDEAQQPVFGAEVVLRSQVFVNDGVNLCQLVERESHRGRTDLDGAFSFSGVNVGRVRLQASQAFFPTPVGATDTLRSDGDVVSATLTLVDTISGELSGVVYLPDGVTPAGAGVEVRMEGVLPEVVVVTDETGLYRFAEIFPQGSYRLTALDPVTGGLTQTQIFMRAGEDVQHDLRLKGRGTVVVTVVDGSGVPVDNAFVTLTESEFPKRVYDGSVDPSNQGALTFENVFEGPFSVSAEDVFARGGRASSTLPGPGESVAVEVRLSSTGQVRGAFRMPDGTSIPFGTVRLVTNGRVIGQTTTQGSGDDVGSYFFDFVPAGSIRLEAEDPLTGRTGIAVGSIDADGQILDLDVVAQGLGTVTGTVRANGVPQPLAHVEIVSGSYEATTFTGSDGMYVVEGVPEGRVVVTASLDAGLLAANASDTLEQDGQLLTIDVDLRPSGRVIGQVLNPADLSPAPPSLVTIRTGGLGGARQKTTTDANGEFAFDRVPGGAATVTVEVLSGIDGASATINVAGGDNVPLSIVLRGVGSVRGLTVDSMGNPVAGQLLLRGDGYSIGFQTGNTGEFFVPEVLSGPITGSLKVTSGPFTLYGSAAAEVLPDQALEDFLVPLQETATVTGTVVRADQAPAHGAAVTIRVNGISRVVQAQTDGRFTMPGVPLGTASATIEDPITTGVARVDGIVLDSDGQLADLGTIVLDDEPVSVVAVSPLAGALGIPVGQPVVLTFSDPVQSFSNVTVLREGGGGASLQRSLSPDRLSLTLTPNGAGWPDAEQLTVEVDTRLTDVFGRNPLDTFRSTFRTVDLSPPAVVSLTPADGAIEVDPASTVTVVFDEDVSPTPDLGALIQLSGGAGPVAGTTVLADPTTAVLTPDAPLGLNAVYTVTVNGAVDPSGNTQTAAASSAFVTPDTIPPVLTVTSPAADAWLDDPTPHISGSVADPLSGVRRSSGVVRLDGADVLQGFTGPLNNPAAASFSLAAPALDDGAHVVDVEVTDRAGNPAMASVPFGIDTVPPGPAQVSGIVADQVVQGTVTIGAAAVESGSGIASVDVYRDGSFFRRISAEPFQTDVDTNAWLEGRRSVQALARDVAGNVGPLGPAVEIVVDNQPLTMSISAPRSGDSVRESVLVQANPSEGVERIEFSGGGQTISDAEAPYEVFLDLAGVPEGDVLIEVDAFGLQGDAASAMVSIVVDRTAPAAPDAALITAQQVGATTQVLGHVGAVEGGTTVEITNTINGSTASLVASPGGAFGVSIDAVEGDLLSLVAIDGAGNRSLATIVTVEELLAEGAIPLEQLALWVSADRNVTADAQGLVSVWSDRSDAGRDVQQPDAAQQPLLVADGANGLPVLRFDGVDDVMSFPRMSDIRTVFWVVRESAAAGSGTRMLLGDCCSSHFLGGTDSVWDGAASSSVATGDTRINGLPVDGTTTARPKQMAVVSLVARGNVTADRFSADRADFGTSWFGDVAELIIYSRALTSEERQSVEDYLTEKYRPSGAAPPAAAPRLSPNGGEFAGSQVVTMTTPTLGAQIYYTLDGSDPDQQSTPYTGPIALTETTTVRARAFRSDLLSSESSTARFTNTETTFSPPAVSNLELWVHTGAGLPPSLAVDHWEDQSPNDRDLFIEFGARQPLLIRDELNGFPVVRLDGVDDLMNFPRVSTIRTVFWVVRESAAAGSGTRMMLGDCCTTHFLGGTDSIWDSAASSNVTTGATRIDGLPVDGTTTARPKEMSVVSLVTRANVVADRFSANGADFGTGWFGDVAELIIYSRALTSEERQSVEDYLTEKYRPSGTVPPAAVPRLSPNGGEFAGSQVVTMTTPTLDGQIYYTLDGSDPDEQSTPYTGPIALTETTTVRARAFRSDLLPSESSTARFTNTETTFSPSAVSNLELWVHTGAGLPPSLAVDHWEDQSPNDRDLFIEFGARQPLLIRDELNGFPVVRLDGMDDLLNFPRMSTIRTVFWVVRESTGAVSGTRMMLGDCCSAHFLGGADSIWDSAASNNVKNGSTYVNGALVDGLNTARPTATSTITLVTTGAVTADRFSADRTAFDTSWHGDLVELIVFGRALSETERRDVEAYLNGRYCLWAPLPESCQVAP